MKAASLVRYCGVKVHPRSPSLTVVLQSPLVHHACTPGTFFPTHLLQRAHMILPVQGKVVFVAPTRPLVAQQIDACYRFMGVPKARPRKRGRFRPALKPMQRTADQRCGATGPCAVTLTPWGHSAA